MMRVRMIVVAAGMAALALFTPASAMAFWRLNVAAGKRYLTRPG